MNGDKLVLVQSKNKNSGNTSDFYVSVRDMEGVWRLESCLLPNTAYHIRSGVNDAITFDLNSLAVSVTMTPGWYTASTLATEAQSKIQASPVTGASAVTVVYSSVTGKVTIAHASLNITEFSSSVLGFNTDQTGATSITGDSVCVLSTTDTYNVHIDGAQGQNRDGSAFMIDCTENSGSYIHHRTRDNYEQLIRFPHSTTSMRVHLRDDQGRAISINGAHLSFTLAKI